MLFTVYCSPVADITVRHSVDQYADDMQLHLSINNDNTSDGLFILTVCTADDRQWFMDNKLQLNLDKSLAVAPIVGTSNQLQATTSTVSQKSVAGIDLLLAYDIRYSVFCWTNI